MLASYFSCDQFRNLLKTNDGHCLYRQNGIRLLIVTIRYRGLFLFMQRLNNCAFKEKIKIWILFRGHFMDYNNVILLLLLCLVISVGFFISIFLTKERDSYLENFDRENSLIQNLPKGNNITAP